MTLLVNQGGRSRDPDAVAGRSLTVVWPAAFFNAAMPVTGGAADVNALQYGTTTPFTVNVRSGVPGEIYAVYLDRPCIRIPPPGVGGASLEGNLNFWPALTKGGGAGASVSRPFFRFRFDLARSAAGIDGVRQGIFLGLKNPANVGLVDVNAWCFGICGDGAGGWKWVSTRGGGIITDQLALVWPTLVTNFCPVEFRLYSATDTQDGRVELWINGGRQISRSWGAGSVLPNYGDVAGDMAFSYKIINGVVAGAGITDLILSGFKYILSESEDLA